MQPGLRFCACVGTQDAIMFIITDNPAKIKRFLRRFRLKTHSFCRDFFFRCILLGRRLDFSALPLQIADTHCIIS